MWGLPDFLLLRMVPCRSGDTKWLPYSKPQAAPQAEGEVRGWLWNSLLANPTRLGSHNCFFLPCHNKMVVHSQHCLHWQLCLLLSYRVFVIVVVLLCFHSFNKNFHQSGPRNWGPSLALSYLEQLKLVWLHPISHLRSLWLLNHPVFIATSFSSFFLLVISALPLDVGVSSLLSL